MEVGAGGAMPRAEADGRERGGGAIDETQREVGGADGAGTRALDRVEGPAGGSGSGGGASWHLEDKDRGSASLRQATGA